MSNNQQHTDSKQLPKLKSEGTNGAIVLDELPGVIFAMVNLNYSGYASEIATRVNEYHTLKADAQKWFEAYKGETQQVVQFAELCANLKQQRDELLEALKYAKNRIFFLEGFTAGKADPTQMNKIDSAINNATQQ